MPGSSLTLTSQQVGVGVFGVRKATKFIFKFVGDSATGAIPNLAGVALAGRIAKVLYNPGATTPTNSTVFELIDPDTGLDVLKAGVTITTGATAQEFYPVVASGIAIQPLVSDEKVYSAQMSGNSVDSATGTIEVYMIEAD